MTSRFSVLVSCHNYRRYVAEAVDSALAQRLPPREVIVVDDGSTDGSAALLQQRYASETRVRVIVTPNRGQVLAFAEAARAASGEVLAFLDADDVWEPGYLEALEGVYAARPEVDFVFTALRYFGDREGFYAPPEPSRDLGYSILLGAFQPQYQGSPTSALSVKRGLAEQTLALPEALALRFRTGADDCLVVGADVLGGRKYHLAEPLVRYRAHPESDSRRRRCDAAERHRHWLRAHSLVLHYRAVAGLAREHLAAVKHEFLTKPQPDWRDVRNYAALLAKAELPWHKRLEQRAALVKHWWRCRGASRVAAVADRSADCRPQAR